MRGGAGGQDVPPHLPGAPPLYPFLGSSFLDVVTTNRDVQKLYGADAAERGVAPTLRRAALLPWLL